MIIALATAFSLLQTPGGGWTHSAPHYGLQTGEKHGQAVEWIGDLDGDGSDDFLVSSPEYSTSDPYRRGAFRLYSGESGALIDQYDALSLPQAGLMGFKVARLGDITGNASPEFAVQISGSFTAGAPGRVAVFSTNPMRIVYEVTSKHGIYDLGVYGLGGGMDVNGDGFPDFAAEESSADLPFTGAGAVHVFSGLDGSLIWTAFGTQPNQRMGSGSVIIPGDVDGDGFADVLTVSNKNGTTMHLLSGADGSQLYEIQDPYPGASIGRGKMSGCGDVDGDGLPDYLAGCLEYPWQPGSARIHRGVDGALLHEIVAPRSGEAFGGLVSGLGDVTGDGYGDFAIGAPNHSSPGTAKGGLYVFSGRDFEALALLESPGQPVGAIAFGGALPGAIGDSDGDGRMNVLTSDYSEDPGGIINAGAAYEFSFLPFIEVSTPRISALAGGALEFALDFPGVEATLAYRLLASDDLPGSLTVHGVKIPLVWTTLLQKFISNPPQVFDYPTGTLDAYGDALVTATIPANALAAYVGRTVKFAAVSLLTPSQPSLSSAAVWVEVLP